MERGRPILNTRYGQAGNSPSTSFLYLAFLLALPLSVKVAGAPLPHKITTGDETYTRVIIVLSSLIACTCQLVLPHRHYVNGPPVWSQEISTSSENWQDFTTTRASVFPIVLHPLATLTRPQKNDRLHTAPALPA